MTRIVCLVCNTEKPLSMRITDRDPCPECGRDTGNRSVAMDWEPIAPWSTVTIERQRELFEQERRRA